MVNEGSSVFCARKNQLCALQTECFYTANVMPSTTTEQAIIMPAGHQAWNTVNQLLRLDWKV
ncbi:MAG: hypothetical protein PHZ09_06435 [Eubacteriales bacterium]|jgi:hypothetical protein|nr:hypothetical protein [Eubacteriales bacterium]